MVMIMMMLAQLVPRHMVPALRVQRSITSRICTLAAALVAWAMQDLQHLLP